MTGRYTRSTFAEDQREFVEHFQDGEQIGKTLDIKTGKNATGPQTTFFGLKSEKAGNQVHFFESFEKHLKFVHEISVQNGSDAFPNELMRFRFQAKPI